MSPYVSKTNPPRTSRSLSAKTKSVTILCGPTASGKSALAVDLARQKNGVIINGDSLQIYDALPTLTAQPSAEERLGAPHLLYGALPAGARCSARQWRDMAVDAISTAFARDQHPVIVGGTGLYLKALVEGLSEIPDVPADIRERAMKLQQSLGNPAFHAALTEKDPVMGARLNPNDTQRLVRAWEVLDATGKSLSVWQDLPPQGPPPGWCFTMLIMTPDRPELHRRCDRRFGIMLDNGALEEVWGLDARIKTGEIAADAPITHALGFHALQSHLRGDLSLEAAIEQACTETRQYAKRQDTWFRHQIKPLPSIEEIRFLA